MANQLVFDLPVRPSHDRGDFFVSPANAAAVASLDAPMSWPNGRMALVGPEGAGKTHLAHVWATSTGAATLSSADLELSDIPSLGANRALVIEDVDRLPEAAETPAFHLLNLVAANKGLVLMTARSAPNTWPIALKDLKSRVEASGVATLAPPDDALLANVIIKLFADRQILPEPALIPWLVARIERSFAAVHQTVETLDRASLSEGRKVSRALARRVLDN